MPSTTAHIIKEVMELIIMRVHLKKKRKRLIMELKEIPTGQMDGLNLHGMRTEFTHLNQTIIMITHNMELAKAADRTIMIEDGKIR